MQLNSKSRSLKAYLSALMIGLIFASAATNAQQIDANSYVEVMLMCASTAKSARDVARMRDNDIPANVTLGLLKKDTYFKLPSLKGGAEEMIEFIYGPGFQRDPEDIGYFYFKGCAAAVGKTFKK